MKVYKYEIDVYMSALEFTHGMSERQMQFYIPDQGVLAFRKGQKIDYFSASLTSIRFAKELIEECIAGKPKDPSIKYFGQIDLPDNEVKALVSAGKKANQAKENLEEVAQRLITSDLLFSK